MHAVSIADEADILKRRRKDEEEREEGPIFKLPSQRTNELPNELSWVITDAAA